MATCMNQWAVVMSKTPGIIDQASRHAVPCRRARPMQRTADNAAKPAPIIVIFFISWAYNQLYLKTRI